MGAKIAIAAAVAAASFFVASQASAAIVTVTYDGVVSAGTDTTGVFGAPASALDGLGFEAQYVFDTSVGNTYSGTSPTQNYAIGGSGYSNASPLISAKLIINGVEVDLTGDYVGYIYGYRQDDGYSQQYHQASDATYTDLGWGYYQDSSYIVTQSHGYGGLPGTIDQAFSVDTSGDYDNGGGFYVNRYEYDYASSSYVWSQSASGSLTTTHITEVTSAPEPVTWAMILIGLFGLGAALRANARAERKLRELGAA